MKTKISAFISGVILTMLINSLIVSAVAIAKQMTITVYPINVKVDGEIFAPRDANGNEVPIFTYNGTTYAPLRALAEAYDLKVGYDEKLNMATVDKQDTVMTEEKQTYYPSSDLETAKSVQRRVSLLKVDDNYYALSNQMDYGFLYFTTIGNLVFADNDVKVTNEGVLDAKTHEPIPYCVSWGLVAPIRFALTEEYVLEPSENPYFRYIKNRVMKKGYEDIQRNAGIEETIWYSPNKSYTPMWLEVNGYKLYNFNEHNAEKTSSRFQVQDGIRYYNGVPCINDVFKVYGIDKEIIFGEYEGFTYIEIK